MLFLFLACSPISVRGQADGQKLIRDHKIKSNSGWRYQYKSGVLDSTGMKQWTQEYDRAGNLVEFVAYDSFQGQVLSQESYRYDKDNRLIQKDSSDAMHWSDGRQTYQYDDGGRLIASEVRGPDGVLKRRFSYNYKKTELIEIVWYKASGEVEKKEEFTHDPAGKLVEKADTTPAGKVQFWESHRYNSQGNAVESVSYNSGNRVISKTLYTYDSLQNLTEKKVYTTDGTLQLRWVYTYDRAGLLSEELQFNSKGEHEEVLKHVYEFYQ